MRGFVRALRRFGTGRIIAILLLVDCLIVRMWDPTPLEALRHKVFDIDQVALPRVAQMDAVAIVDLDEASLKAYGQWPRPRTLVAELVTRLNGAGAAVIGFDVLFPEPDRTSPAAVAETAVGLDARRGRRCGGCRTTTRGCRSSHEFLFRLRLKRSVKCPGQNRGTVSLSACWSVDGSADEHGVEIQW